MPDAAEATLNHTVLFQTRKHYLMRKYGFISLVLRECESHRKSQIGWQVNRKPVCGPDNTGGCIIDQWKTTRLLVSPYGGVESSAGMMDEGLGTLLD